MRRLHVTLLALAVTVLAAMLLAPAVTAQEGTPNLATAQTWQGEDIVWQGQARIWPGSENVNWELGFRGRVNDETEATLTYFAMDNLGEGPIGGGGDSMSALRASDWRLLTLGMKWQWWGDTDSYLISFYPALEWSTHRPTGTNTVLGASAWGENLVPSVGFPIQWDRGKTSYIVEPKVVWFESRLPVSGLRAAGVVADDGTIAGFGTVFAVGVGMIHQLGSKSHFIGDFTAVLGGENAINENTNEPEDEFVWSAGVRWTSGRDKTRTLDLFATNAAGSTTATSVLAAPDNGVGIGARLGYQF